MRKAVLLLIGTMLVLGSLFVWGVPVLVKLAVLLGNINSSRRPIDKSDLIPPAPPTILATFEATNSATQTVRGWAEPGASVFLTQNSESLGSVVAKDSGEFLFSSVVLADGKNVFAAVAIDSGGNKSLESVPFSILFSNKLPKLEINTPSDGQTITDKASNIEIKGLTDPGMRLTVNGRVIVVPSDGNFVARYSLAGGENVITLEASDRAGNKTQKTITVTYSP